MRPGMPPDRAYAAAFQKSRALFRSLSPDAIARASLCAFDAQAGCFVLTSFGHTLRVCHPDGEVTLLGTERRVPLDWALIVLNHLSRAKPEEFSGVWKTFGDLPEGRVFNSNLRDSVFGPLGAFYGKGDKNALRCVLGELGFTMISMNADLAARGSFAPRVPIVLQFWDGEEDLPSTAQVLFDYTITSQMHTEDIAALCGIVKRLLLEHYSGNPNLPEGK